MFAESFGRDLPGELLLAPLPRDRRLVTVNDGHSLTLSWLGVVAGHRRIPLGVEHFGQSGTIGDLYARFGIDCTAIVRAVGALTAGRMI